MFLIAPASAWCAAASADSGALTPFPTPRFHACRDRERSPPRPAARESIRALERQYFAGDKDRRDDRDDRREGRSDGSAGGRMAVRLGGAGGRMAGSLGGRLDLDARPSARYEPYGGGMRMDRMEPTDPRDRVLPGPGWRGGGDERWGGRGRGGGGRREPREARERRAPKSAEDLDKAMENYWKEDGEDGKKEDTEAKKEDKETKKDD